MVDLSPIPWNYSMWKGPLEVICDKCKTCSVVGQVQNKMSLLTAGLENKNSVLTVIFRNLRQIFMHSNFVTFRFCHTT